MPCSAARSRSAPSPSCSASAIPLGIAEGVAAWLISRDNARYRPVMPADVRAQVNDEDHHIPTVPIRYLSYRVRAEPRRRARADQRARPARGPDRGAARSRRRADPVPGRLGGVGLHLELQRRHDSVVSRSRAHAARGRGPRAARPPRRGAQRGRTRVRRLAGGAALRDLPAPARRELDRLARRHQRRRGRDHQRPRRRADALPRSPRAPISRSCRSPAQALWRWLLAGARELQRGEGGRAAAAGAGLGLHLGRRPRRWRRSCARRSRSSTTPRRARARACSRCCSRWRSCPTRSRSPSSSARSSSSTSAACRSATRTTRELRRDAALAGSRANARRVLWLDATDAFAARPRSPTATTAT